MTTEQRKKDHLKTCLEENVETPTNGFEDVILINKSEIWHLLLKRKK